MHIPNISKQPTQHYTTTHIYTPWWIKVKPSSLHSSNGSWVPESTRVHQGPPGSLPSDRHWSASCRARAARLLERHGPWRRAAESVTDNWMNFVSLFISMSNWRNSWHFTAILHASWWSSCQICSVGAVEVPWTEKSSSILVALKLIECFALSMQCLQLCRGCAGAVQGLVGLCCTVRLFTFSRNTDLALGIIGIPMCHSVILFLLFLINLSLLRWWVHDFREIAQLLDMTSIQGQCMLAVLTTIVDRVRGHICWCFCYIATFHLHFIFAFHICISFAFHLHFIAFHLHFICISFAFHLHFICISLAFH